MNINDICSNVIPTDFSEHDRLDLIFMRQHELAKKYFSIEERNGLLITSDLPVNLDDRFGQARLKDFFWRVTEELTEAVDACRVHQHIVSHTYEELADSLHFLVETCILSGLTSTDLGLGIQLELFDNDKLVAIHKKILNWHDPKRAKNATLETYIYEIIHAVGCASNCLKQRPWKQTHQETDKPKFYAWLKEAFFWLILTFRYLDVNPNDIFAMYWKKSEVNKFRQRSNY